MSKSTKLTLSETEIGLRAYQIWEAEGQPHGKDFEHWLKAKAELAAATEKAAAVKAAPAKKATAKKPAAKKA